MQRRNIKGGKGDELPKLWQSEIAKDKSELFQVHVW